MFGKQRSSRSAVDALWEDNNGYTMVPVMGGAVPKGIIGSTSRTHLSLPLVKQPLPHLSP